jgi:hypothetical protein
VNIRVKQNVSETGLFPSGERREAPTLLISSSKTPSRVGGYATSAEEGNSLNIQNVVLFFSYLEYRTMDKG